MSKIYSIGWKKQLNNTYRKVEPPLCHAKFYHDDDWRRIVNSCEDSLLLVSCSLHCCPTMSWCLRCLPWSSKVRYLLWYLIFEESWSSFLFRLLYNMFRMILRIIVSLYAYNWSHECTVYPFKSVYTQAVTKKIANDHSLCFNCRILLFLTSNNPVM